MTPDNPTMPTDAELIVMQARCDAYSVAVERTLHPLHDLSPSDRLGRQIATADVPRLLAAVTTLRQRILTCCFCGESCGNLESLKSHSAVCRDHPLQKQVDAMKFHLATVADQRDKSKARVAELEADAERLDYLEDELRIEYRLIEAGLPVLPSLFRANQPITRQAIDAAMSAWQGEGD